MSIILFIIFALSISALVIGCIAYTRKIYNLASMAALPPPYVPVLKSCHGLLPPTPSNPPCVANVNAPPWLKTKGLLSSCQKFSDEIIKNWDSAGAGGGGILPAKYRGHGECTSTFSLNLCVGKEEKDNKLCVPLKSAALCGLSSRCSWIGQPCSWVRLLPCDLAPAKSAKGTPYYPGTVFPDFGLLPDTYNPDNGWFYHIKVIELACDSGFGNDTVGECLGNGWTYNWHPDFCSSDNDGKLLVAGNYEQGYSIKAPDGACWAFTGYNWNKSYCDMNGKGLLDILWMRDPKKPDSDNMIVYIVPRGWSQADFGCAKYLMTKTIRPGLG